MFSNIEYVQGCLTLQLIGRLRRFTRGICTINQPDGFICPATQAFGTASIIVRPPDQFQKGFLNCSLFSGVLLGPHYSSQKGRCTSTLTFKADLTVLLITLYSPLTFFFLIGAVAPIVPWALSRKYPKSFNFRKYIKYVVV